MGCLISIAGLFGNQAFAFTNEHIGYLYYNESNIKKLETEFEKLDVRRMDIQTMVDEATRQRLAKASNEVQTWLEDVRKIESEVMRIRDEASMISTNCFLNINMHYKLGRDAANHVKTIDDLLKRKFDKVACECPPPSTTDSLLYNKDYLIFDSRKSHVNKILEALTYEAVHSIGLWGMGGVGKTMLVKDVAQQAKKQSLFHEVVIVTVSQNIDLKKIQTVMAESLSLELKEKSEEVRAVKLANKLATTQNKILMILDDLWETLDLSKVGILLPQMAATCKVVITTRNKDICDIMSCQEIVELKTLSDEESWRLFASRAGDAVESPTMRESAQNIVKECAGLPLALVVLGTALKGKRLEIWKTVLIQLKRSMDVGLLGVSKQVFQSIKISFDFLESEEAKSCFLHCCLYPEDFNIPKEELMHLMVGGGILIGDETLNDAQGRVDLLLDQLKAHGLLLQGSSKSCVRMHDVVRDAAIQIGAMADHAFYARAGHGLTEWPRTTESEMQNCRRLSLMNNDIEDLPPDPMQYPKLEMLILRKNQLLSSIPEMFFLHMGCLMILDLSSTDIESLPESVSCLTNLRVLNLSKCKFLWDIFYISFLKRLEILILDGCPVSIVPIGVGWTQNLRFVNLNWSMNDYFSKEFSRFHRLEQLFMDKFEGSFLELIISLRHLTHLFISEVVGSDDPLSHELVSFGSWPDRLVQFSLSFLKGQPMHRYYYMDGRALKLMRSKPLAVWVKRLLKTTIQLTLVESQETELISIDWLSLLSLEYLEVDNWPNLTKLLGDELLLHEQMPLSQLKNMFIKNCPRLTSLIPSRLCQGNLQLWSLQVQDCPMMLELFPCDPGAHDIIELLPRLRSLDLRCLQRLQNVLQPFQYLPNLKRLNINNCGVRYVVSSETETVAILADLFLAALKSLDINNCGVRFVVSSEMEIMAILVDPFPTLEVLIINDCEEMSEMISPPASLQASCFFQGLCELYIEICPRLTYLFSYKQAISMHHLSMLFIRDCAALGAVVISKENKEEASSSTHVADHESYKSPFPNLRNLTLLDLPQLTAFHHPTTPPVEWLHLTSYNIQGCPKLQEPLEERIRSLRARMEKKTAGSVKGEEEEAGDLSLKWYLEDEEEEDEEEEEEEEKEDEREEEEEDERDEEEEEE